MTDTGFGIVETGIANSLGLPPEALSDTALPIQDVETPPDAPDSETTPVAEPEENKAVLEQRFRDNQAAFTKSQQELAVEKAKRELLEQQLLLQQVPPPPPQKTAADRVWEDPILASRLMATIKRLKKANEYIEDYQYTEDPDYQEVYFDTVARMDDKIEREREREARKAFEQRTADQERMTQAQQEIRVLIGDTPQDAVISVMRDAARIPDAVTDAQIMQNLVNIDASSRATYLRLAAMVAKANVPVAPTPRSTPSNDVPTTGRPHGAAAPTARPTALTPEVQRSVRELMQGMNLSEKDAREALGVK